MLFGKIDIWEWLKRLFLILIIIQIIAGLIPLIKQAAEEQANPKVQVGWIELRDVITDSSQLINEARYFAERKDIKAVVLRVNSGGGYCGSSEMMFRAIENLNKVKPVFALIENVCASGAFMTTVAATKIFAMESSVIGSIGVLMEMFNFKRLMDNWNVDYDCLTKGEFKSVGNTFTERISDKQKKYLLNVQDGIYDSFIEIVAEKRKLKKASYKTWAEGKIFNGIQAVELGLVDQIGDIECIFEEIKVLAQSKSDEKINIVKYPRKKGLAAIFSQDESPGIPEKPKAHGAFDIKEAFSQFFPKFL